jgi:hypothetical protein
VLLAIYQPLVGNATSADDRDRAMCGGTGWVMKGVRRALRYETFTLVGVDLPTQV